MTTFGFNEREQLDTFLARRMRLHLTRQARKAEALAQQIMDEGTEALAAQKIPPRSLLLKFEADPAKELRPQLVEPEENRVSLS